MVSLDLIEKLLSETIYPQLEKGRPNWDKPHTISVVEKMKEILEHSPTLKVDKVVLLIAAYAHDWGYSGLFEDGKKLNLDDVMGAKVAPAVIGARKLTKLLENHVFDELAAAQKERAVHLVRMHDNLGEWKDMDELLVMEADTLGGLDMTYAAPSFDADSNERYMNGVRKMRIPYFITDYGKREVERLFRERMDFYSGARPTP